MKGISIATKGIKISVVNLPGRKKPCLYVQIDNCIYKVASFDSEKQAVWFCEIVEEMIGEEDEIQRTK